jgi:hypothetical protein
MEGLEFGTVAWYTCKLGSEPHHGLDVEFSTGPNQHNNMYSDTLVIVQPLADLPVELQALGPGILQGEEAGHSMVVDFPSMVRTKNVIKTEVKRRLRHIKFGCIADLGCRWLVT